jgi:hypothetical protein
MKKKALLLLLFYGRREARAKEQAQLRQKRAESRGTRETR